MKKVILNINCFLLVLFLTFNVEAASSYEEAIDVVAKYEEAQRNSVKLCDQHAAHPDDTTKPAGVSGVTDQDMNAKLAYTQCIMAWQQEPKNARIAFQAARAEYMYYHQRGQGQFFTSRDRYWIKFEAAYRAGSKIAGEYFSRMAPQAYEKVKNEVASRSIVSNLTTEAKTQSPNKNVCSVSNGRLFNADEISSYLKNKAHSGIVFNPNGILTEYRSDFSAREGRENTADYQLISLGKVFEGIAYIPTQPLSGKDKGAHFCSFFSKPIETIQRCYKLIKLNDACPFQNALFETASGVIASVTTETEALSLAKPYREIIHRQFDITDHMSQNNVKIDESQYNLYAELLEKSKKGDVLANVIMKQFAPATKFVDVKEEIKNLTAQGKFKDLPGGLYLSAIYDGQFEVLKHLDRQAATQFNKQMNALGGTEILGSFTALFANQTSRSNKITDLYRNLFEHYSLIAPAMASYVLSFGEIYPQCLGDNPVSKKVVTELQDVLTDGYGFEVPISSTRIESVYRVKQELGDILFKYSDKMSLSITGALNNALLKQGEISIQDVNLGTIKAMRQLSCDSAEAEQFESNLLSYWREHNKKSLSYSDELRALLSK